MSYIKLLVGYNTVVPKTWVNNMDSAFNALSNESKSEFLLEQSVIVSYLKKVYNNACPTLLKNYVENITYYISLLNHDNETNVAGDEEFKENVSFINELMTAGYVKRYDDLITRLQAIANKGDYPHVFDLDSTSFYRPFLTYYGSNGGNVSISGAVSIPTLALRGCFIFVSFTNSFIGYHFNETIKKQLDSGPYPISTDNILAYWSGYNWKDSTVQNLLGILSTYSFDLDCSNGASNSYELIYKLLKSVITGYRSSVSPYVDSLSSSFDDTALRRIFISFIIDLRKVHGLKLDDAHTLAKIMGNDNKEDIDNLSAYLEATSATDVSAEMLHAFRNSIFSDFEELDIKNRSFKKKVKIDVSSSKEAYSATTSILSLKETIDALRSHDVRTTWPAPLLDASKKVDESDTKSAGKKDPLSDMGADPTNEPPSSDVGATGADDTPGTESDTEKDPSAMENDENNPSMNNQPGQPETPDTHVPDLPDVSDKKGVKLELSSSESTDTVFYRLELKTYINSILANPPKSLSVEKIEILKKIKAFWINTLAPQCVHDILNTVISLPKMFQIHKSKKTK